MVDMNVEQLIKALDLTPIALPCPTREVNGAYIGDLLSWVMGRAGEDNAWITIMSNSNIVAVATLADVSCIILAEGVVPDPYTGEPLPEGAPCLTPLIAEGVDARAPYWKTLDNCN